MPSKAQQYLANIERLGEEATPPPWVTDNIPGTGCQIKAKVAAFGDALMTHFRTPASSDVLFKIDPDGNLVAMLAYEEWVQFPSDDWRAAVLANAALIVALANSREAVGRVIRAASDDALAGHSAAGPNNPYWAAWRELQDALDALPVEAQPEGEGP